MYVFLIFGAVSITVGIFALWLLPDLPSTAKFLNERERAIAIERVAVNRQGVKNHRFKWDQVGQAARDPKTWLLFFMAIGAQVPNSAITSVCTLGRLPKFTMLSSNFLRLTQLIVYIYYREIIRFRHPGYSILTDPRWCSPIPYNPLRGRLRHKVRKQVPCSQCLYDLRKCHLYHRSGSARRAPGFK